MERMRKMIRDVKAGAKLLGGTDVTSAHEELHQLRWPVVPGGLPTGNRSNTVVDYRHSHIREVFSDSITFRGQSKTSTAETTVAAHSFSALKKMTRYAKPPAVWLGGGDLARGYLGFDQTG
jgi:hypothetical protein